MSTPYPAIDTPEAFRIARISLGLSTAALAQLIGITAQALTHIERGRNRISDKARAIIIRARTDADTLVEKLTAEIDQHPDCSLPLYYEDAVFREYHPDLPYPASWWAIVVWRVRARRPGVSVERRHSAPPKDA